MTIFRKKKLNKTTNTKKQPSKNVSIPSQTTTSGKTFTYGSPTIWATNPSLGVSYISSSVSTTSYGPYEPPRANIDLNQTDFTFKLLDGTEKTLSAKEYFDFIAYNEMTPGDCKNEKEYLEKVMAIKL